MEKIYKLLFLLFVASTGNLFGQASIYSFAATSGTFTANSAAATFLPLVRADNYISPAQNIGFNFVYEGVTYTTFKMGSNGYISLNATGGSAINSNDLSSANPTTRPIIAPLWDDLDGLTPASSVAGYEVTGVSPNRILTVEWLNWEWNWNSATPVISFQVKLYEGSNIIQFVYRQEATAVNSGSATIGIGSATGSGSGSYLNLNNSSAAPVASSTVSTTDIATKPATGQIYTFTPPTPCTGTPEAGTISGALIRPTCGGLAPSPTTATATGFTTGVSSLVFQWETSLNNSTWSNATGTGATTATYTLPNHTAGQTEYYRLKVTCTPSGLFDVSDVVVQVTDPAAPTTQASLVTTTALGLTTATISWTAGSGSRRYAVINTVNSFTNPVGPNNVGAASTVYGGSGEQIIFDGTGNSVSVTGLTQGTVYYVRVYEYLRCSANNNYYNITTSTGNPGSFTTLLPPSCPNSLNNPITISSLPFDTGTGQTTCGNGNNVTSANVVSICGSGSYYGGEDKTYIFTPTVNGSYTYTLNTTDDSDQGITLYQGCPFTVGSTCIGFSQSLSGLQRVLTANLVTGVTYYLVVDNYPTPACIASYQLTLDLAPNPPGCATLVSPTNGATGVLLTDPLTWTAPTAGAAPTAYKVYHGTVNPPTTFTTVAAPATSTIPAGRLNSTTYYWYVVPTNAGGDATGCNATIYSYTTVAPPPPPVNDECINAITLIPTTDCATPTAGTTISATQSLPGCLGTANDDVWYKFTATSTSHIIIITNTGGAPDIVTQVVSGSCGGTQLACQDTPDSPINLTGLSIGTQYFFRIYTYSSTLSITTNFTVCVITPPAPPANDNACNATVIPVTIGDATTRVSGSLAGATLSSGTPTGGGACATDNTPDIWFKFVAPASGNCIVEMFYNVDPVLFYIDPSLSIYTGGDPCTGNLTTYVACNDDKDFAGGIYTPYLSLTGLTGGNTYYARVTNYLTAQNDVIIAAYEPMLLPITSQTTCQTKVVNISAASNNLWGAYPVLDASGSRICNIIPNGNSLGNVTVSVNVNTGSVRQDAKGIYYLDRSFTITPTTQPTSQVELNFFIKNAELAALQAVDPAVTGITSLNTTKNQKLCGLLPSSGPVLTNFGGITYSTLGYILGVATTSFSTFYLHGGLIPLPVNILSFDAQALKNKSVQLTWNVAAEVDVKEYVVERSNDNKNWSAIGSVKASQKSTYDFNDNAPASGINYYRLAVKDVNASVAFSDIRTVNFSVKGNMALYPNPANNTLFVSGTDDKNVVVSIYNEVGQIVNTLSSNGENIRTGGIDVSKLIPGAYSIQVKGESGLTTMRFVKQ